MEAVLIALFGACAAFFSWRANVHAKDVKRNTTTNHGHTAGEYLEMILDVKDAVLDTKQAQVDLKEQLIAHTAQDNANFDALQTLINTRAAGLYTQASTIEDRRG